jgi:hypothetical protein
MSDKLAAMTIEELMIAYRRIPTRRGSAFRESYLALEACCEEGRRRDAMIAALQAENAALAELAALPAQGEALDFPDGPGWWAFEGYWTTAFPERAVIFHYVYDIYLMTDGIWYFQMDNDGHPVGELTGKWYRLHLPWDAPTPPEPPAAN